MTLHPEVNFEQWHSSREGHNNDWSLELLGSRHFCAHRNTHREARGNTSEGQALRVQPVHKGVLHLQRNITQLVEDRNVVFVETPWKVVPLLINEPGNIDEVNDEGIIRFHDGPKDDDMLRGLRGFTSRVDLSEDVTHGHTTIIMQPRDPAKAEIPTKIRGFVQADVLAGEEIPA